MWRLGGPRRLGGEDQAECLDFGEHVYCVTPGAGQGASHALPSPPPAGHSLISVPFQCTVLITPTSLTSSFVPLSFLLPDPPSSHLSASLSRGSWRDLSRTDLSDSLPSWALKHPHHCSSHILCYLFPFYGNGNRLIEEKKSHLPRSLGSSSRPASKAHGFCSISPRVSLQTLNGYREGLGEG